MKYTLGRAALSRAHHMFLIHHHFSTHACKKPERNLNGPVSNMAAPEHWLCISTGHFQGATRNCSLPMHTTHRLLQTTHPCQPARTLQEKRTASVHQLLYTSGTLRSGRSYFHISFTPVMLRPKTTTCFSSLLEVLVLHQLLPRVVIHGFAEQKLPRKRHGRVAVRVPTHER